MTTTSSRSGQVRVVDADRRRVAVDLVGVGEDLVALGQAPRAATVVADQTDHREPAGIDVGADRGPLDVQVRRRGPVGPRLPIHQNLSGVRSQSSERTCRRTSASEEGRAVRRRRRCRVRSAVRPRSARARASSSRRTTPPRRPRSRRCADRRGRGGAWAGREPVRKCSPCVLGRKPGTAFESTIEAKLPLDAS